MLSVIKEIVALVVVFVVFSYCFSHSKTVYCLPNINANYSIDLADCLFQQIEQTHKCILHLRWLQISSTALIKVSLRSGWSHFSCFICCTLKTLALWSHFFLCKCICCCHFKIITIIIIIIIIIEVNKDVLKLSSCHATSAIRANGNQLCKTIAGFCFALAACVPARLLIGNICGEYDHKCTTAKLCINTACFCWWHFLVLGVPDTHCSHHCKITTCHLL